MADYNKIDTNGLLPGEPVTSAKMLALNENPTAIAEGATNAPKIASKNMFLSGNRETLRFSGLSDFSGFRFYIRLNTSAIVMPQLFINTSTPSGDGTEQLITTQPVGQIHGYLNKITGSWSVVLPDGNIATGTLGTIGVTVDELIFRNAASPGSTYRIGVHVMPDGGESAS